jgi:hypothetical protein
MVAALAAASPVSAQADALPDPATVTLPDMTPTRDPAVIADGWKHFYFHRAGASYAEAYADFADCYRFLPGPGIMGASLPMFRRWTEPVAPPSERPAIPNNFGLAGAVAIAIVSGPLERRDHQSRLRRCMEPRGYVRYPLREEIWRQLIDDYSERSIALQAKAASGPAPGLEPLAR